MAGPGNKDQTASTRSAEPPRPVRQTRQASKAQRETEAANVAAHEPFAPPQPTRDEAEVATRNPDDEDPRDRPPRRFMPVTGPGPPTSPASYDFDQQTMVSMATPARVSYFPPNRKVANYPAAVAQPRDANQEEEFEYESSSSESERPIQRRPPRPRRTYLDDAHAPNEMTIEVVTGHEQNSPARGVKPRTDDSGTAPSHYQRGNQNSSDYPKDARLSLQRPGSPQKPNQSPRRDPPRGLSQTNVLKRQQTIDEREEENEDEEGAFETNNRPAKQRVTGRENGEKLNSSRNFVVPAPEPVLNDRQGSASRAKSVNGTEESHSEHNEVAVARGNNGNIDAQDVIEASAKARETALKYRSGTKKPQIRSPWTAGDVAKLITAIGEKGCSWSELETALETLSTTRNQQQIRDKARNIKVDFLLGDIPLPHGFDGIALGKKEREKVISCERNPDREEADVDDNGNAINCRYTR